jgi:hypothetical protein
MHDELWAGVDLKLENAFFHLNEMDRALQLPERTHYSVALQASGAIVGKDWQRPLYAHLDAFLSATRSVGQIIKCGFGADKDQRLKPWARCRRKSRLVGKRSSTSSTPHLNAFNERLLSTSRHISEHRIGASPGPEHEKSTPHGQAVEVIISALKRRLSKPRHVTACLPRSRKPGFFSLDWPGFF